MIENVICVLKNCVVVAHQSNGGIVLFAQCAD